MASVRLERVRKVYPNGVVAVHGVSVEVGAGEFVVLVGPSGCGKSTTLRMIAGLESITDGDLWIGDRVVNDVPAAERDIAMVFQNYALYPHMTVFDNMSFALRLRKQPRAEIERRVRDAAAILGIEEILDRKPRELSGGQRQRVAVGRAIVRQARVFLFDEPLSNLDARLRVQMRKEIAKLHRRLDATMIYVTHDQVEAMTLGDRIVVLNEGHVQQIGTPLELYDGPANRFVAGFIGSPGMNFITGVFEQADGAARFRAREGGLVVELPAAVLAGPRGLGAAGSGPSRDGGGRVASEAVPATRASGPASLAALGLERGKEVVLGIRPEDIYVAGGPYRPDVAGTATLDLELTEPMGNEIFLYARSGPHELVARVAPQGLPASGSPLELALDATRLHFFDPRTGDALRCAPVPAG